MIDEQEGIEEGRAIDAWTLFGALALVMIACFAGGWLLGFFSAG